MPVGVEYRASLPASAAPFELEPQRVKGQQLVTSSLRWISPARNGRSAVPARLCRHTPSTLRTGPRVATVALLDVLGSRILGSTFAITSLSILDSLIFRYACRHGTKGTGPKGSYPDPNLNDEFRLECALYACWPTRRAHRSLPACISRKTLRIEPRPYREQPLSLCAMGLDCGAQMDRVWGISRLAP